MLEKNNLIVGIAEWPWVVQKTYPKTLLFVVARWSGADLAERKRSEAAAVAVA